MPRPLPLSASRADEVAEQFRTPLHLYDEKGIRQNVRCLLSTFDRYFPPLFGEQDDDQHDGNTPMQEDERLHATITPFQRFDPNFTARCSVRGPFKQFYAVKALPNPAVIRVLLDEGVYRRGHLEGQKETVSRESSRVRERESVCVGERGCFESSRETSLMPAYTTKGWV